MLITICDRPRIACARLMAALARGGALLAAAAFLGLCRSLLNRITTASEPHGSQLEDNPAPQPAQQATRPPPFAVHGGLAVYRFGAGAPLLFMPYPHAVSTVGDGPPVLIALLARLAGFERAVITFDPPASGQSIRPLRLGMPEMLDCAEEALALCGISGPVDVFGHSQGGVAALAFALERPERVGRLVLANTSSGGPAFRQAPGAIWNRSHPDFWRFAMRALLYLALPVRAAETHMNNLIFRDSYVDRARLTPAPIAIRDWLRRPRPRVGWGQRVAWRLDYRLRLAQVRAPTLVTAGSCDPQMPIACAEELARSIPSARLVVFERSGHYPFVEEPDAFRGAVGQFLATTVMEGEVHTSLAQTSHDAMG